MIENVPSDRWAQRRLSMRIRAVGSESLLGVFCIAKNAKFLHTDKED